MYFNEQYITYENKNFDTRRIYDTYYKYGQGNYRITRTVLDIIQIVSKLNIRLKEMSVVIFSLTILELHIISVTGGRSHSVLETTPHRSLRDRLNNHNSDIRLQILQIISIVYL